MANMWSLLLSYEDVEVTPSAPAGSSRDAGAQPRQRQTRLVAKCYDLESKSVHKQCLLADREGSVGVVAVQDPGNPDQLKEVRIYALPLGAAGSVPQFNRVAVTT